MRVLVVRTSAIGDCVMATWAVSALRREAPGARIVWLVEGRCAPVIEVGRLVDARVELPRKGADGRKRRGTLLAQLRMCAGLARERFDVGVDLQGHAKTALALRLARPRVRALARARDALAARMGEVLPPLRTHEAEFSADALARATGLGGVARLDERPIMPDSGPGGERGLATIAVSAGRAERALAAEAVAEVARGLVARGMRVELLGGPRDRAPEGLAGSAGGAILDRVGRLTLRETMGRIAASEILVAGDTGAGHIAAAYGTPVVSVFGPSPSAKTRPWTSRLELLEGGARSDSVGGEAILGACDRLLARRSSGVGV